MDMAPLWMAVSNRDSRAWCSQATNDPVTPTLVATTYSGRLAEVQMEKNSVLNRDYFEQLKEISIPGKLAEQTVITYADNLSTAMNSRSRFESDSVVVPDPHPCTKTYKNF